MPTNKKHYSDAKKADLLNKYALLRKGGCTAEGAAAALKVPKVTLYSWITKGKKPKAAKPVKKETEVQKAKRLLAEMKNGNGNAAPAAAPAVSGEDKAKAMLAEIERNETPATTPATAPVLSMVPAPKAAEPEVAAPAAQPEEKAPEAAPEAATVPAPATKNDVTVLPVAGKPGFLQITTPDGFNVVFPEDRLENVMRAITGK